MRYRRNNIPRNLYELRGTFFISPFLENEMPFTCKHFANFARQKQLQSN